MNIPKYANVTQEDIDKGVAGDCRECPLARAIHRAFVEAGYNVRAVGVQHAEIYVELSGGTIYLLWTKAIRDFVAFFDENDYQTPMVCKPHRFRLFVDYATDPENG